MMDAGLVRDGACMLAARCGRIFIRGRVPAERHGGSSTLSKSGRSGSRPSSSFHLSQCGQLGSRLSCDGLSSPPGPRQRDLQTLVVPSSRRLTPLVWRRFLSSPSLGRWFTSSVDFSPGDTLPTMCAVFALSNPGLEFHAASREILQTTTRARPLQPTE